MPIDTSIYPKAPQGGIGQMNPIQLLQMADQATRLGSDLAVGQSIKGAADPTSMTGVNADKLKGLLTQNPMAARQLMPTMTALQQLEQAGIATSAANLENLKKKWDVVSSTLTPLISKKDLGRGDVLDAAATLLKDPNAKAAGLDAPQVFEWIKNMPQKPEELRPWLVRFNNQVLGASERLAAHMPKPEAVNVGDRIVYRDANPLSPSFGKEVSPPAGLGLPPTTEVATSQGKQFRGQTAPDLPRAAAPGEPGTAATSRPGAAGAKKPEMATLPPGAEGAAVKSAERASKLQEAGNDIPVQRSQLDNMEAELNAIITKTGPTADLEKTANALTQRLAGFGITMSAKELAAMESFDKIAKQIAQTQAQSFHSSDASLNNALGANPNTKLSGLGIRGILNMLQGNLDALAIKHSAWNDYLEQPGNENKQQEFDRWSRTFNKDLDPRAFQFARMSPDERRSYLKLLSDKDKKQLAAKLEAYVERGWVQPPQ